MTAPEAGAGRQAAQRASSAGPPRVVVADDHGVLRASLRARLASAQTIQFVDDEFKARALNADVVLLDMWLPGTAGLPAIQELKRQAPKARILVLTVNESESYVRAAFQAGADGYLLKSGTPEEILSGIEHILRGKRFISETLARHIVNRYLQQGEGPPQAQLELAALTGREREVLRLIAQGLRNREIAVSLFLSVKTVEKHRSNLMNKLNLHNTAALTSFAVQRGLLGPRER